MPIKIPKIKDQESRAGPGRSRQMGHGSKGAGEAKDCARALRRTPLSDPVPAAVATDLSMHLTLKAASRITCKHVEHVYTGLVVTLFG